jgi:predicted DNA-binding transcriptional regulator YafY
MRNEGELGYYAPIKFDKAEGGYYYENPNYTISEVPLNDEDLHAIRAAAETLYQFKDIPLFKQFDSAIEKIMDRMKISAVDKEKQEHEIIQFEKLADYRGSEFLQPLFSACSEKRVIELSYLKFTSREPSSYVFAPYLLKEYRNRWYAIGQDCNSELTRTFALDRIQKLAPSDQKPPAKKSFDAHQFFEHAIGITVTDEQPELVELHFSARFAPYIITQPIHKSQKIVWLKSGELKVTIDIQVTIEVVSTILGFGDDVKVVIPNDLKNKVKLGLTKCLEHYK